MSFDSPIYIIFLVVVCVTYWRLGFRAQNRFLLLASYFFYGWWDWRFLCLIWFSTTADFLLGQRIASATDPRIRKRLMFISVAINLSILGFFKYFNFFIDSFAHVARAVGLEWIPSPILAILLPPAISFYTFQEIAYIVDVYERRLPSARNFIDYALFVSLFPHLIAGPIQQPSHLLPQVQSPRQWDSGKAFDGLLLVLEGLARKVIVADSCGLLANAVFAGHFGQPTAVTTLLGVYAFAWQIYGDFSGYSSIARGSAQLLGFHFMVNFRQPYLATTLRDFWRRWHISLSTFLRDYLYIRLGGSRRGERRTYVNLITTMLLGGLWHGANWTFVVWGGIHGTVLALERKFGARNHPPAREQRIVRIWLSRLVIFHVVCLAWIFFRARTFGEAHALLASLTRIHWEPIYAAAGAYLLLPSLALALIDLELERSRTEYLFGNRSYIARIVIGSGLAAAIALFAANASSAFIYFQF